jgi:hypothetical protein
VPPARSHCWRRLRLSRASHFESVGAIGRSGMLRWRAALLFQYRRQALVSRSGREIWRRPALSIFCPILGS